MGAGQAGGKLEIKPQRYSGFFRAESLSLGITIVENTPAIPATMYEAFVPHNTESTGPFALMFRIWENENMGFTYQSGYIHYGMGTIDQSSELIQTTYNDSVAYLGLIPKFEDVTGTTVLSY